MELLRGTMINKTQVSYFGIRRMIGRDKREENPDGERRKSDTGSIVIYVNHWHSHEPECLFQNLRSLIPDLGRRAAINRSPVPPFEDLFSLNRANEDHFCIPNGSWNNTGFEELFYNSFQKKYSRSACGNLIYKIYKIGIKSREFFNLLTIGSIFLFNVEYNCSGISNW